MWQHAYKTTLPPLLCSRGPISDDLDTACGATAVCVHVCEPVQSFAVQLTFEDGGPPLHVVLVPADPPELGGPLAVGGLAQRTGLHSHSQACTTATASIAPATATGSVALPGP